MRAKFPLTIFEKFPDNYLTNASTFTVWSLGYERYSYTYYEGSNYEKGKRGDILTARRLSTHGL
jgi:hypothetical protein